MKNNIEFADPFKYREGIFDICSFLVLELKYFLEKENRYYGTLKSYVKDISEAYRRMDKEVTEDDIELYGKILWNLRPQIYFDFGRLGKKRLSHSDRVIVLMKRLLDYSTDYQSSWDTFRFQKEIGTVHKLVTRMYENVKNPGKENKLYSLKELIETSMNTGKLGKVVCHKLSLVSLAFPPEKKKTLVGKEQNLIQEHQSDSIEISL